MQNNRLNIDKYTLEVKSKIDNNFLSPLFIRYANLLYANEQFEECISVCKTGLEIYPNYLTAKLLLLKSFLKAEYLNEAETLFKEIKCKITNTDLLSKLDNNIQILKSISGQEKIYYTKSIKNKFDFKAFEKQFNLQADLFSDFSLNNFFEKGFQEKVFNEKEYENFQSLFESFHFEKDKISARSDFKFKKPAEMSDTGDLLSKIKIVTETLADIYAAQGNFKEAFEAYKMLIRAGSKNKNRIEVKLNELERNMIRNDKI